MKKLLSLILASGLLLIAPACHRGGCGSCGTDQYHHEHMEKSCTKCGENPCGCKMRKSCNKCGETPCGCKAKKSCNRCSEGTCKKHCRRCEMPVKSCRCNK